MDGKKTLVRAKKQLTTTSAAETEAIGESIGRRLRGGEMLELASDLGGGKTTWVRGLARGAGSDNQVASPTFTISKMYDAGQLQIHHFDFYRLEKAGIMQAELQELLGDPAVVVIVEWSGIVLSALPEERLTVTLEAMAESESMRRVTLEYPESLAYLSEDIKDMKSAV
jgi:tRNA threonylcarbamoyladenosine biosynthesis protein TsaE